MDFDQMLDVWRAQNMAPPYDVNRDALRQALQAEVARVGRALRQQRRALWFVGLIGAGMAVWAAFWIAITITNGWPAIYAVASGVSVCIFAFGAGAIWVGRRRLAEPEPHAGNTLQDEARRILAHVDRQLSRTGHVFNAVLGATCLVVGTWLFSWTVTSSQGIRDQSSAGGGWSLFTVLWFVFCVWAPLKAFGEARKAKPKLEIRQRRLRELLVALEDRE